MHHSRAKKVSHKDRQGQRERALAPSRAASTRKEDDDKQTGGAGTTSSGEDRTRATEDEMDA